MEETIAVLTHELDVLKKEHALAEAQMQMQEDLQKKVKELTEANRKYQYDINILQQENFSLQGRNTSNLKGKFPTIEEILNSFVTFCEQDLVNFIFEFQNAFPKFPNLPEFLQTIVWKVVALCDSQYNEFFAELNTKLYRNTPGSLLGPPTKLFIEIRDHLQHHYDTIMGLQPKTIEKEFVEGDWKNVPGFTDAIVGIVKPMHNLIWKVKLTPRMQFAFDSVPAFLPHYHHRLMGSNMDPVPIFPPIQCGNEIVVHGYAL